MTCRLWIKNTNIIGENCRKAEERESKVSLDVFSPSSVLLRDLEPRMPEEEEPRAMLMQWIHLLVDPLTSANDLAMRTKRNRYLFMICESLMTGTCKDFLKLIGGKHLKADGKRKQVRVAGMKSHFEPEKHSNEHGIPLTMANAIDPSKFEANEITAVWERENCWETRLQTIQDAALIAVKDAKNRLVRSQANKAKICPIHKADACPKEPVHQKIGENLDRQFKYLLYLTESYQTLMDAEKEKLNLWLQALSKIDKEACVNMKGVRNDYISLLVGYVLYGELKGPFEDFPTMNLPPLTEAIATYIVKRKPTPQLPAGNAPNITANVPLNPLSDSIEAFMNQVPKIDEGAFALLSLNANLFNQRR